MGRTIFVCCDECVDAVRSNPRKYLALIDAEQTRRNDWAPPKNESIPEPSSTQKWGGQLRCPVTGKNLGSMGTPLPVNAQGRTVFVCCKSCVATVTQNPTKYFQKVDEEMSQIGPARISASEKRPNIPAKWGGQKSCPVTGEELGTMGPPIPVKLQGRTIYVCCKACVNSVKRNPEEFLAKIDAEMTDHQDPRPTTPMSGRR